MLDCLVLIGVFCQVFLFCLFLLIAQGAKIRSVGYGDLEAFKVGALEHHLCGRMGAYAALRRELKVLFTEFLIIIPYALQVIIKLQL